MTRRERIRQGMSGGTSAPNGRRAQLRAALAPRQPRGPGGRSGLPPGNLPAPQRFPQVGKQSARGNALVNPQPKLGAQLAGRVASGAINEQQASKVAQQRQMLRKAFGSDWRSKIYGQGGARGISGPFAQRQVAAKRAQGLARAKRKLY